LEAKYPFRTEIDVDFRYEKFLPHLKPDVEGLVA
jgi:hypothetical protein